MITIVLADDEKLIRAGLKKILLENIDIPLEIIEAKNGEEALKCCKEKKPEIPQEIPSTEEQDEPEEIVPIKIGIGRMRLELGKAYTFGSGKWKVSGDSTSYAPGITFYVPSEGDYEFSQE